jgi:hypothetical protein
MAQRESVLTKRPPAPARFATPRTDRPTAGDECVRIAERLNVPLMPWQRQVLDVGLEYEPDPDYPTGRRFIYREIDFGTPRQSGKSVLTLVKSLHRMVMCGPGQRSVYSMQSGAAATKKLLNDWVPMIEDSQFSAALTNVRRASGSEQLTFRNRSMLLVLSNKSTAGHGMTLDEAILDEVFADVDDRREQAVFPAMLTRANAQALITSTAGTDASLYWRRKVDIGREIALGGGTDDICYFEWSAPDEADAYDEETWWGCMPALGFTQSLKIVRHLAKTMREDEFRRSMLNQWTRTDASIIDWGAWVECRSAHGAIAGDIVLSADMNEDRTATTITAASLGADGLVDLEVIERNEGMSWIVPRLDDLRNRHLPRTILVDGAGPIGALIPEMERMGLPITIVSGVEMPRACGAFYDAVMARKLRVRQSDMLDDAVAGASKRIRGDAFVWRRSTPTSDISPIVGATLAAWGILGNPNHGALWLY